MEEFYSNIQNDPFSFYFLVVFALLWGGGVIWGVVFVIRSLGKKRRSFNYFLSAGFTKVGNNRALLKKVKAACAQSIAEDFFSHVDAALSGMSTDIILGRRSISLIDAIAGRELFWIT